MSSAPTQRSSAPGNRYAEPTQPTTQSPAANRSALDQAIATTNARIRGLKNSLEYRIDSIEEVLPDKMKGQGARLVKRALMTFARRPELQGCPDQEFIRCVVEAAELGLAIDGKLCHVVRFKNTWQMLPDYKGIIAVAKRGGSITDCYADVVCVNDHFEAYRQDGKDHLTHKYDLNVQRGAVIGAYAIIKLPDGDWRYELMTRQQLDDVQKMAPAKNGPWAGPFASEMQKKTVIRRALKTYCDDPATVRATELADQEYEQERAPVQAANGRSAAPPASAPPAVSHSHHANALPNPRPIPPSPESQEPSGEPSQADMNRQDLVDDIAKRIDAATTAQELAIVGADLTRDPDALGEAHADLIQRYQQRYRNINGKKPEREPGEDYE